MLLIIYIYIPQHLIILKLLFHIFEKKINKTDGLN